MISFLCCFRKRTQGAKARPSVVFSRRAAVSGPFAAAALAAALAVFPLTAKADEVMSVTRDQIAIGTVAPDGNRNDLFLATPPKNMNGSTPQGWNGPVYPMPEVQVYVPWPGSQASRPGPPPHQAGRPSGPGQWGRTSAQGQRPPQGKQPAPSGQRPPRGGQSASPGWRPPQGQAPGPGQNPSQRGQPPASGQRSPYGPSSAPGPTPPDPWPLVPSVRPDQP